MSWNKKVGMPKIERKTHVIDAEGKVVGRIASAAARILMGKHKTTYMAHVDTGDIVQIVNASKAEFTGKKWDTKAHIRTSNRPGGITRTYVKTLRAKHPDIIIKHAVKYMLPKNSHLAERLKRLKVTA